MGGARGVTVYGTENKGAEVAVLMSKLFHPDHWRILMKFRTTPVYVFMV